MPSTVERIPAILPALLTTTAILLPVMIAAQEKDTTSAGYQVGYQIGSWIPFVLLAGVFVLMLRAVLRRTKERV
jgi:cytochrome c biogenesis protein CcdA